MLALVFDWIIRSGNSSIASINEDFSKNPTDAVVNKCGLLYNIETSQNNTLPSGFLFTLLKIIHLHLKMLISNGSMTNIAVVFPITNRPYCLKSAEMNTTNRLFD